MDKPDGLAVLGVLLTVLTHKIFLNHILEKKSTNNNNDQIPPRDRRNPLKCTRLPSCDLVLSW